MIMYCTFRIRFTDDAYTLSEHLMSVLPTLKITVVTVCTTRLTIKRNSAFYPHHKFHLTVTTKRQHCPKFHWMFYLCNGNVVSFLWCRNKFYMLCSWFCCFILERKVTAPILTAASFRILFDGLLNSSLYASVKFLRLADSVSGFVWFSSCPQLI